MRRTATLVVLVPAAVAVIVFSLANRHPVAFSLDPVSEGSSALSVELPLYWLLFAALAIGVVIGGVATWIGQGKWRREARRERAEALRWRREAERRRQAVPPAGPALPAPGRGDEAA